MRLNKIAIALVALTALAGISPVLAQKTKSQLTSEYLANLPDNVVGTITPSTLRTVLGDQTASWQQFAGVNGQTGTSYTVQLSDYGQLVTFNNSSAVAVSLPQATGSFATFNFYALNLGTGTVTITPTTSTINGAANLQLAQNASVWIVSDGTNYQIFQGRSSIPTGTDGQILTGQTGGAANFETMSQDCTFSKTGVITCSKTNNVAFGPLATVPGGTSGGVQCWTGATTPSSSSALTQYGIVYGGGAGVCPGAAAAGGNGMLLLGVTGAPPQMAAMSQDCTITNSGVITCTKTNNVAFGPFATQTAPCAISQGCTSQTTVPNARGPSGLNIDEVTTFGDASYAAAATDRTIATTATFTAQRTVTLPTVASFNPGQQLVVIDSAGAINGANDLVIAANAADTINGTSSITISAQYGGAVLWPIGSHQWGFIAASSGGAGTVTAVVAATGLSTGAGSSTISTSGTLYALPLPQGRLTLASNTPVMTISQTSQSTLYYDCFHGGNVVPYYNGTSAASEGVMGCQVSDAMVAAASAGQVVSGQVYDVWWVHGGTNRICLAMSSGTGGGGGWASDTGGSNTQRGTGYSALDTTTYPFVTNKNVISFCFNGATNYGSIAANQATYLGTVYASGNGVISYTFGSAAAGGGAGLFGVWNMYNRVPVATTVSDTVSTWTYNVATTWRAADNSSTARVSFVRGLDEDGIAGQYNCSGSAGASTSEVCGIGLDSTTAFSGTTWLNNFVTQTVGGSARYSGYPGLGFHFLSAIELNTTTTSSTWDGSLGTAYFQSGLHVELRQ